ncbi:hypothetical protein ACFPRL_36630 [Pseudoclavibacter helvolus]
MPAASRPRELGRTSPPRALRSSRPSAFDLRRLPRCRLIPQP